MASIVLGTQSNFDGSTLQVPAQGIPPFCLYSGCTIILASSCTINTSLHCFSRKPSGTKKFSQLFEYHPHYTLTGWLHELSGRRISAFQRSPATSWYQTSHRMQNKTKLPITQEILIGTYSQLDMFLPADAMFRSICLIAFYSYIRKSNLIPSHAKFDPNKHLRKTDLLMFNWGIINFVRWSKVIQFKQRTLRVPISKIRNSLLCPFQAYGLQ